MKNLNILIADEMPLIRDAIATYLRNCEDIHIAGQAADCDQVRSFLEHEKVDILLLGLRADGSDSLECARMVQAEFPRVRVIVLSLIDDSVYIRHMISHGAAGCLLKNTDGREIVEAIRTVSRGDTYYDSAVVNKVMAGLSSNAHASFPVREAVTLTPREEEILELIIQEYSNQEIATRLYISTRTVDAHKRNLLEKTNSRNLVGLVKYAIHHQLVKAV